jgi:hypothetical protein
MRNKYKTEYNFVLNHCLINIIDNENRLICQAVIDKDDFNKIKDCKWRYGNGYLRESKTNEFLHQKIVGSKPGYVIDHRNLNKLDNRKENLRYVTKRQNAQNNNGKGYWKVIYNGSVYWRAEISINGKRLNLGRYKTENEAIEARKQAELKCFGEFSNQAKFNKAA